MIAQLPIRYPLRMVTPREQRRVRIGFLVAGHLALGLVMAIVAFSYPGFDWPTWIQIWFLGLISSEMLVLGIWAGFATTQWWLKVGGLVAGIGWMTALSLAPSPSWGIRALLEVPGFVTPPVLIVACACMCCRRWLAAIQRRANWQLGPVSKELQFTLKSIIALTITVSILLALGRIVRSIDEGRGDTVMTVLVFSLLALLAAAILVWASLGLGRIAIRIPTAFVGMAAVGLIFPYYLGGPPLRYWVWPLLTLLISVYVVASLLIVRSCGYRLVPVWHDSAQ